MKDIFNPKMCFARELKASWSKNIITRSPGKVPIRHVSTDTCLVMEHDPGSEDDWFIVSLPLNKQWQGEDLTKDTSIDFSFYAENVYQCQVFLKDSAEEESDRIRLTQRSFGNDALCNEISIPLSDFDNGKINMSKIRMLVFIGGEDNCFYVSKIGIGGPPVEEDVESKSTYVVSESAAEED